MLLESRNEENQQHPPKEWGSLALPHPVLRLVGLVQLLGLILPGSLPILASHAS